MIDIDDGLLTTLRLNDNYTLNKGELMKKMDKILELKIAELVKIKNSLDGISVREAGIIQQHIIDRVNKL